MLLGSVALGRGILEHGFMMPSVEASGLATLAVTRLRAQLRELGFYDRVSQHLAENRRGVLIDGVESGGAAGLAHLQRGDVVIRVGTQAVGSPGNWPARWNNRWRNPTAE